MMNGKNSNEIRKNSDGSYTYLDTKIPIVQTIIYILLLVGFGFFIIMGKIPIFSSLILVFLSFMGGIAVYKWWKDYFQKGGTEILSLNQNGITFHLQYAPFKKFIPWNKISKIILTDLFYLKNHHVGKSYLNTMLIFIDASVQIHGRKPERDEDEYLYYPLILPEQTFVVVAIRLTKNSRTNLPEIIKIFNKNLTIENYKEVLLDYSKSRTEYKI